MKHKALLLVIVIGIGFTACQQKESAPYMIRISLITKEDHTWYKAFKYFEEIVEDRSEGNIQVEVYPSEQLAKEIEAIRLIQAEVIEMTMTGSMLSNWIDVAAFCELPFLLRDSIDKQILLDGPIGRQIEEDMLNVVGLRPVAFFERGPRHLTSNRPIKHPDDLKGLIIRVPNVPSFVTAWSAMGAKPTPMAFSEVFTSLQQGTVEAQENPFAMIASAGFAEVQDYVNLTEHVVSWTYSVIGEKQFQKLPLAYQQLVLDASADMQDYEHQLFIENELQIKQRLEDSGMTFIKIDKVAFGEKCKDAIYNSLDPEMQLLYRDFINSRDSIRLSLLSNPTSADPNN